MVYETIIVEREEGVAIIRFNRPRALNAINSDVIRELAAAIEEIRSDASARVLVLTGAGEKAFIAGADISHMVNLTPLKAREFALSGQNLLFNLERLSIPVIACVNGFALGGGTEFAMACDFIYASEKAKFGQPEINLGLIPGFGGTQRLSRLVGKAVAKELCLTGAIIDASEALRIGLVNKVFPADRLWEETMKAARLMASKGRAAVRGIKGCIDRGVDLELGSGCGLEADNFALCFASPDAREGMSAFLEKRSAVFKGEEC